MVPIDVNNLDTVYETRDGSFVKILNVDSYSAANEEAWSGLLYRHLEHAIDNRLPIQDYVFFLDGTCPHVPNCDLVEVVYTGKDPYEEGEWV